MKSFYKIYTKAERAGYITSVHITCVFFLKQLLEDKEILS